jgi:hypothetical protein
MKEKNRHDDQNLVSQALFGLVHTVVHPNHFESTSRDPNNLGHMRGHANKDGSWSIENINELGDVTRAVFGAFKQVVDSTTHTGIGHEDQSHGGGKVARTQQGEHQEHGADSSHVNSGTKQNASEASTDHHSTGGHGKTTVQGDKVFTVDEGGYHMEASKGISFNTPQSLMLHAGADTHFDIQGGSFAATTDQSYSIDAKDVITLNAPNGIVLTCGQSKIVMGPEGIVLQVGSKGIQITSSDISITKQTLWVGDTNIGSHDATPVGTPFHIP